MPSPPPLLMESLLRGNIMRCALVGDGQCVLLMQAHHSPGIRGYSQISGSGRLGSPYWSLYQPSPASATYAVSGVTKDSSGAALGNCTVDLFYTGNGNDPPIWVNRQVSDGSGNYRFSIPSPAYDYRAIAYLLGSPDVAGTTITKVLGS